MHATRTHATAPPRAKRIETTRTIYGRTLTDAYAWLADRDDPDVIRYLEEENAFTEASLAKTDPLREQLFVEMRSRIQEADLTVPALRDGFLAIAVMAPRLFRALLAAGIRVRDLVASAFLGRGPVPWRFE